jgi:hypothetical protein
VNGAYDLNGCGHLRGSLSRRKVVKDYLKPDLDIYLGNFANNHEVQNNSQILELLRFSDFDIFIPTKNDLHLIDDVKKSSVEFISNTFSHTKIIKNKIIRLKNGVTIFLTGISCIDNLHEINAEVKKIDKFGPNIKIMMANVSGNSIDELVKTFNKFDIIILAQNSVNLYNRNFINRGVLCSSVEAKSRTIGVIDFYLVNGRVSYNSSFIPLFKFLKSDQKIEEILGSV